MANRPTGFWYALESVLGSAAVDAEWKDLTGVDYGFAKTFLRPNGKLASSYQCTVAVGCGCEHEIVIHNSEDIVAVCRCERGCDTFRLKHSDIVMYQVDRSALDAVLAKTFGLIDETSTGTDLRGTTLIGVYSPYAGFRFSVYSTILFEPDDFDAVIDGLLAKTDDPFILLSPTRLMCSIESEKKLTAKRSICVPLSETLTIDHRQRLQFLRPLDEILDEFRAANVPSPKKDSASAFFPTPTDATWGDVLIRFIDGHTVSITVKSVKRVFNYTQMGMANRKNSNPTVQWKLLEAFAEKRGVLEWSSPKADRLNQKRREILAKNLREFFRIEGDPFRLTDDGKGWRARFLITPDE